MTWPKGVPPMPTPESIAAARRAQAEERERLFRETGLVVTDDGLISPLLSSPSQKGQTS